MDFQKSIFLLIFNGLNFFYLHRLKPKQSTMKKLIFYICCFTAISVLFSCSIEDQIETDTEMDAESKVFEDTFNHEIILKKLNVNYSRHSGHTSKIKFRIGDWTALGDGFAVVWYYERNDQPEHIGITFTPGSMDNLVPMEDPNNPFATWYVLNLPEETLEHTMFDYLLFNWNPMGHPPHGIYTVPHFDFHFYMQSNEERLMIPPYEVDPSGFLDAPTSDYFPPTYFMEPGGVPQMGAHWVDSESPEWNDDPFGYTFIYGSYEGKVTFYEPMITKEILEDSEENPVVTEILQPEKVQYLDYFYPEKYNIFGTADGSIHVTISDFEYWD